MSTATIEKALLRLGKRRRLPAVVTSWRVESGPDAAGDPAVWVWVTLAKENVDREARSRIRDLVRDEVRRSAESAPAWVYVRFRSASEVESD